MGDADVAAGFEIDMPLRRTGGAEDVDCRVQEGSIELRAMRGFVRGQPESCFQWVFLGGIHETNPLFSMENDDYLAGSKMPSFTSISSSLSGHI